MKRLTLVLAVALAFFVAVGVAGAAWVATGTGSGYSKGLTMPAGNTPTVSVSGVNVTVSWTANTIGGAAVSGYNVDRYNTSDVLQSIGSACTGLVASTSCVESSAPAGRWKYKVKPLKDNWVGAQSAFSAQAHVVGAPTAVSCTNCYTNPRTSAKYIYSTNNTSVSVQVDLPATSESGDTVHLTLTDGTNTVTPATKAGTTGSGSLTWTGISASTLNQASVSINAWVTEGGSTSATTTTTVTKDTVVPTMSDVQAGNGGSGTGTPENGDWLIFTFSERIEPRSMLAGWDGASTSVSVPLVNSTTSPCLDNLTITGVSPISKVCFQTNNTTANITYSTSTMDQTGVAVGGGAGQCATANYCVKVTLAGGSTSSRAGGNAAMTVTIVAGMTDVAGNGVAATTVTEGGASDKDL